MENLSTRETIMEEREELVVPYVGSEISTLKIGHFLKPSSSVDLSKTPPLTNITKLNEGILPKVEFKGRRYPQRRWNEWVDQMLPRYQHIWKKAGIFDAIMASTYKVLRDNDLVIELAEKWCEVTNSFIFPWGEATVTLEDMMVLGGFSVLGESVVLGDPVRCSVDSVDKVKALNKSYKYIQCKHPTMVTDNKWINHFLGKNNPLEHEAFLSLWLCAFVFPMTYCYVGKHVFPLAIHISMGIRFALAPAVLASIYRDLSLLKKSLVMKSKDETTTVTLWAPFQLVQLWAWERFPSLGPTPNALKHAEPRAARWHRLSITKVNVDTTKTLDFLGESFQWRPYTMGLENWDYSKFYWKNEKRVLVESDVDMKLESFARCIRVSEIVGMDFVEHYLPHRVAMQFGFDQDVPCLVSMPNQPGKIAWDNYVTPIDYSGFYMPSRLLESDVTTKYAEWFNQMKAEDHIEGIIDEEDQLTIAEVMRRRRRVLHVENNVVVDETTCPGSEISSSSAVLARCSKKGECANDTAAIMMESANVVQEEIVEEGKSEEVIVASATTHLHDRKDDYVSDAIMESGNMVQEEHAQMSEDDKLEEGKVASVTTHEHGKKANRSNDAETIMVENENVAREENVRMSEEDKLEEGKVVSVMTHEDVKKIDCSNDAETITVESGNVDPGEHVQMSEEDKLEEAKVVSVTTHVDGKKVDCSNDAETVMVETGNVAQEEIVKISEENKLKDEKVASSMTRVHGEKDDCSNDAAIIMLESGNVAREENVQMIEEHKLQEEKVGSARTHVDGRKDECSIDVGADMMESGNVTQEENVQMKEEDKLQEEKFGSARTHGDGRKDECSNDVGADMMESGNMAREENVQMKEEDKLEEEKVGSSTTHVDVTDLEARVKVLERLLELIKAGKLLPRA